MLLIMHILIRKVKNIAYKMVSYHVRNKLFLLLQILLKKMLSLM